MSKEENVKSVKKSVMQKKPAVKTTAQKITNSSASKQSVAKKEVANKAKKNKQEVNSILNEMKTQFVEFYCKFFGKVRKDDEKYQEAEKRIEQFYTVMKKREVDDYDMMVVIKYRVGKKRNPNSFIEEQPAKKLVDVLSEGFDVPADVSLMKLEVHPTLIVSEETTILKDNIFEMKFGITKKEECLTSVQLKNRFDLNRDGMVLTTEDLEKTIFKFYAHDINKDPYYKTHNAGNISQL